VIYAAFAVWIFAIVFAARGTVGFWTALVKPRYLAWALLPGTLVSELGYFLACLLTGAEFQGRKLVDGDDGKGPGGETRGGVPYLTPLLAGLLPMAACMGLIYLFSEGLDHPTFERFRQIGQLAPQALPDSGNAFWDFLRHQVDLLQAAWTSLTDSLDAWPWNSWKAWILQYLMICLTLRMAPSRRPMRPALAGAAVLAGLTAAVVALFSSQAKWLQAIWPVVSYTWATALLLLTVTLAAIGLVRLAMLLAGRTGGKPGKGKKES
jgi:hypothetical protein